ncbi:TPA: LuxR C-terminal-related transcriptional regulator [Pseudomonas aeruginosa]
MSTELSMNGPSAWPILPTKFAPPTQAGGLIEREVLLDQIERNLDKSLLLICAPAGYGKSCLMTALCRRLQQRHLQATWLSLDGYDNDVVRFSSLLLSALDGHSAINASGSHHGLGSGPSTPYLAAEILERVMQLPDRLYLFLDDFHLIDDTRVLELVGLLLASPVHNLHLVIASRELPRLPLSRLRALGQLHEIDSATIAFSEKEARQFMAGFHIPELSEAQLITLLGKTEGWPASLRMASIALEAGVDIDTFLQRFSGADRDIAAFLVEEVLAEQSQEIEQFLLATSLLKSFNAELANEVLGIISARDLIDQIEVKHLFLLGLDRERNWYRYHHLFADLLRRKLMDRYPQLAKQYHRRAGQWLAGHKRELEAIEHAFILDDQEWAGALLDRISPALFSSGQTTTLQALADQLDANVMQRLPRLQLELVWDNIIRWRFFEARRLLFETQQLLTPDTVEGGPAAQEQELLRVTLDHRDCMLQTFTDQLRPAEHAITRWLEQYRHSDSFMLGSARVAWIMCQRDRYQSLVSELEVEELRRLFLKVGAGYGTVFLDVVAGCVFASRGQVATAERLLMSAHATAIRIQGRESSLASMAAAPLVQLRYEADRVDEARALLAEISDSSLDFGIVDSIIARLTTAARLARTGPGYSVAHEQLDAAQQFATRFNLPRLRAQVLAARVQLHMEQGQVAQAERLLERDPDFTALTSLFPEKGADSSRESYAMAYARVCLENGQYANGIRLLRRWASLLQERQYYRPFVRVAVLLARLLFRSGDNLAARRTLIEALSRSEGQFVRLFVDEGEELRGLLLQLKQSTVADIPLAWAGYLDKLLAAFGQVTELPRVTETVAPEASAEILSERELEIIRLTAQNLVAEEVAHALGLTENTVKWYWQRIFEKLGVRKRKLAVRAARERGLIH